MPLLRQVVFILLTLLGSMPIIGHAQGPSLQGTWSLDEVVFTAPDAPKWVGPQGLLMIGKTHFTVVHVEPLIPRTPLPPPKIFRMPTDAEKLLAADHWDPVIAISGTYSVKGTSFTLTPTVGKTVAPSGIPPVIAEFSFDGNNTLRTVVRTPDGKSEFRRRYTRVE